ncbi:MAG: TniB family NTP-binding protein [Chloroflexota bacterium]|nr:TniB family NTP-binding protein [Chloroflexota bacterium]
MTIRRSAFWLAIFAVLLSFSAAHAQGAINWTSTGGPTGGLVNALAIAPNAPGAMYAGTNGGVYFTRDDGAHWQLVSKGLPDDPTITALSVSNDVNVVFAGTHNGIYRTRDAGASWTIADSRFADQFILSLLIDPQTPTVIYAGTATTVLRSDNGGDTWSEASMDLRSIRVWSLALSADSSTLYAATDTGIYSSRDRGARWQASSDGLPDGAHPQAIVVTARGFLAGTTQGLFRSKDGKAWSAVGGALGSTLVRPVVGDPRQPDRVFAATAQGVARSTDGGVTWSALSNPPSALSILSLAPGDKNTLYAGTERGVWKSADEGATWLPLSAGLVSTGVHAMFFVPGNPGTLLAATRFGLAVSQDQGSTWQDARGLIDPYVLSLGIDSVNTNTVYVGTWGSSLFVSKNGGMDFTRVIENLANNAPISSLVVLHPADKTTVLYAGTLGNGLQKSTDGGQKWAAQSGLGNATRVGILTLVPPAALYAGTERGLYRLDAASANAAWQAVASGLPQDEVRAVVFDPRRPQTLFIGFTSNGLYRSDDEGVQWRAIGNSALSARSRLQTVTLNPGFANVIYVGTDRGVYRSDDDGATWNAANDGLLSLDIQSFVVDPNKPEAIFAGTNGNGVVRGVDQLKTPAPPWLVVGVGGAAVIALLGLVVAMWRARVRPNAQQREWARHGLEWETAIKNALWTHAEANETNTKIPRRYLTRALQRHLERHSDDALTLQVSPPALKFDNALVAQRFLSHWKAAWEVVDSEEAFKSVTSQMVDQLCGMLGFTRGDERSYQGLVGYVVKAAALRLRIPPRFPIIFIPRHEATEQDLGTLRDLMGVLNMVSYFALIIDLRDNPAPDARVSLKRIVRQAIHDFIVLDGSDIRNLLAARDHGQRLVEIILDQVDLTVVSPYVTSGPVPANMFFGREYELKTIVRTIRDTNFAIVGGRKIGKTSVLARVHQLLQETPEYKPFYLDCQAVHTYPDFFEAVDTMWKTPLPTPTVEGFRRMAIDLPAQYPGRLLVMLFDEIDGLLQHDLAQGEQLFQILRALSQEGQLRLIFCGEKVLNASLHDPHAVFFNFCNLIALSYLKPEEARRVVVEPMQEMGITLESDGQLADEIVELAAGHPNIVQYICQKLIERINQRRERHILRTDVQAVSESAQFAEYFAEVSWGHAGALERLITLLMLDQPELTVGETSEAIRTRNLQVKPAELESAFEDLCLYSILRRDGPKYTFAANAFPQVLQRSQDVSGLLLSFIEEIQNSQGAL